MEEEDRKVYYEDAMRRGLDSRLQVPFFTTVGKSRVILVDNLSVSRDWNTKVKTPKYNNPRSLYSDDVMDEMVSGTTAIKWVKGRDWVLQKAGSKKQSLANKISHFSTFYV